MCYSIDQASEFTKDTQLPWIPSESRALFKISETETVWLLDNPNSRPGFAVTVSYRYRDLSLLAVRKS